MAVMLAAFSVLSLYVETILQIYVILTSHAISVQNVPIAMASLATTLAAFIVTSVSSFVSTLRSSDFSNKRKVKIIFGGCHILSVGLLWRIFKLILSFTDRELKELSMIRLVHVVVQSVPYIVLYTRFFIIGDKINVIQALSLSASTCSSALALTSYNLRHKLASDSWEDDLRQDVRTHRAYGSVVLALTGTICVLTTRLASVALMAVQRHHWTSIPVGIHFALMLLIFILSVRHNDASTAQRKNCIAGFVYILGMSLLNTLDLVNDNIDRVMCKYVGFYSILLIENIVLLSFWLLGSDLLYVTKLVTVLSILTAFIIGLVIKFIGCNMLQDIFTKLDEAPSLSTSGTTAITVTNTTTATTTEPPMLPHVEEDDLISIVQASIIVRSLRKLKASPDSHSGSNTFVPRDRLTQRTRVMGALQEYEMYSLPQPDSGRVHNSTASSHALSGCHSFDLSDPTLSFHLHFGEDASYMEQPVQPHHSSCQDSIPGTTYCAGCKDVSFRTVSSTARSTNKTRGGSAKARTSNCHCCTTSSADMNDVRCHGYTTYSEHPQCTAPGHSCKCCHSRTSSSETCHAKVGEHIPATAASLPAYDNQRHLGSNKISYVLPEGEGKSGKEALTTPVETSTRTGRRAIPERTKSLDKAAKFHRHESPSQTASLSQVLRGNEVATVLQKQDARDWVLEPTAFHPTDHSGCSCESRSESDPPDSECAHSSETVTSDQSGWEDRHSSVSWPPPRHHRPPSGGRLTEHGTGTAFHRNGRFTPPRESIRISSEENILKWLDDTERCRQNGEEFEHYTDC